MLCVIAFCSKDRLAAIRLLNWIAELDGAQGNPKLLLVAQHGISKDETDAVISAGRTAFEKVWFKQRIHPDDEPLGRRQSNWMFREALAFIRTTKELNCPFFWCEPDCVPLKTGWLDAIEKEYTACGKPFMGAFVPDPIPHMNGIAVYPPNVYNYNMAMAMADRTAWDLSGPVETMDQAHNTKLIQHVWSLEGRTGPPVSFPDKDSLKMLRPEAVIFHRCNNGSLIQRLQGNEPEREAAIKVLNQSNSLLTKIKNSEIAKLFKGKQNFTIVITTHNRPTHLLTAFESCANAGIENIIITATGQKEQVQPVFDEIQKTKPDVKLIWNDIITSNQSWLAGVVSADTEYVALLHDDDLILPQYASLVESGIKADAPFIMVQARNHGVPDYINKESDKNGFESVAVLLPKLHERGQLSISPVRGMFLKSDLESWLKKCEDMPSSCFLRPGFLVGNDLAIWLNAVDKYKQFWNAAKPGVSFGHWNGSTTVAELDNPDTKLRRIYDTARQWHESLKDKPNIPKVHFLTIVLDGMPFIAQHLQIFNRLSVPWRWHIVEGAAANTNCTKWCKPQPARLSNDGTTEYLNSIKCHPCLRIYRKELWDGKIEMVNAPLIGIQNECVLFEIDCDEFWTAEQIERIVKLFDQDKTRTHAMFWCRYFFGPHLVMNSRNCYANSPTQDWKRVWRFKPGKKFIKHEPPIMEGEANGFSQEFTDARGLVFDHYGYALPSQVEFKERFYGYSGAKEQWSKLQRCRSGEVRISDYLNWVNDNNSGTVKAIT